MEVRSCSRDHDRDPYRELVPRSSRFWRLPCSRGSCATRTLPTCGTRSQRARLDLLVRGVRLFVVRDLLGARRPLAVPARRRSARRASGPCSARRSSDLRRSALLPARAGDVLRPYLVARQEGLSVAGDVRHDRHGARARPGRRAGAAGGRSSGASRTARRCSPALLAPIESSAAVARRAAVAAAGRDVGAGDASRADRPARAARRIACCRTRVGAHAGRRSRSTFSDGFAVAREPRELVLARGLVVSALDRDRAPRRGSSRARSASRMPFTGSFLAAGAARDRRRGADAGRRRQLPRGVPHRRDDVLSTRRTTRAVAAAIVLHAISFVPVIAAGR